MPKLKPQYTAEVTPQYKQATANKRIRYTIEQNIMDHPEILEEFDEWISKARNIRSVPSFDGIFHGSYMLPLFDIRKAEIREDHGQRNALTERSRKSKILGIAKKFDPMQFQSIDIDYLVDEDVFIIRDGGGRSTAAYLNGVFMVPASVRIVRDVAESRRLFNAQDKYNAAISSYDKFLQQLLDNKHSRHKMACDTWSIANSSGFCLDHLNKSAETPLVEGISTLQRIIRHVGGDHKETSWGKRSAPNVSTAIDLIKTTFVGIDEIPVSALEAITAFVHVSKNRIPSGEEGFARLKEFMSLVRDSSPNLSSLNNWSSELLFDSSNNYATYGAAALMKKWNEVFKNKNRGRTSSYRYVKWDADEIFIINSKIMQFSRDDSLYPNV